MIDAEITTKIFMKMLKAATTDGNGDAIEIDDSNFNHDPFHDFKWQLKNVNINVVSQCKVGDDLNLIRERKTDAVNYLGVATKSGEHLGDIESSDVNYYGLMHEIDHGAKTSIKIKQIFTTNGNFESINIKVFIGDVNLEKKNTLHFVDSEAKEIITKAKSLEKTNHEASVSLYRKAIEILKGVDHQCEKHFSTWRKQKFPINRLSVILEKTRRYQECLDEIEAYEKISDKLGLYVGEKEIIEKRKERMRIAIKKYPADSKMLEPTNKVDTEIKSPQDLITVNEYIEDTDLQRFFKAGNGLIFSVEPQDGTYEGICVGMSVYLWIPKVKNPDFISIYPRNAPYPLGVVPPIYFDIIARHLLKAMEYDARIIEHTYNSYKIKCILISKEETKQRKAEKRLSLRKELTKPYNPKKSITLMIDTKKENAVKLGEKLIIEFGNLNSYNLKNKWHIKFINQHGDTIGIFYDDYSRDTIQRILKAHFNSYLFDIEVSETFNSSGYPIKLVITPYKKIATTSK